ncbi:putative membrane protein [Methanonatronarchaeum thermophilum]|uniref:Putative membrane protein n=1 Tax=Methanonatronarchaeum thermophilum TaxID=1927129 RepID=A0A1Y3GFX0_9EURY|nr:small multi-drug export protein [Methanonatronarchaeum thermophilum]OUJ18355.1 putative membrane protein [Methanonatronarchaeum thermophilum]
MLNPEILLNPILIDTTEIITQSYGAWQYILIFILAATPWIEILIVVPAGIIAGLNPYLVAITASLGNIIPIYIIIYGYNKLENWWKKNIHTNQQEKTKKFKKQRKKAIKYWEKYGILGLAIISPALIGIHLATIVALTIGSNKNKLALYMTLSIIGWTTILTITTIQGITHLT